MPGRWPAASGGAVVVKLGGSFAFSVHLREWVEALAACAGRVVVVPGGGPFADTVRSSQPRMGFDDRAAHHMAVLAMEQFGRGLISLHWALAPADTLAAIARELAAGRVPVWMPARMVLGAPDIAESWEATADSLAAWLAGRIGAERLLLVKHIALGPGPTRVADLTAAGIVDRAFARHLGTSAASASIVGPSESRAAAAAIRDGTPLGTAVE